MGRAPPIPFTWRGTQQKWRYEVAKDSADAAANRCRACRRRERERRAGTRRVYLNGLARKQRLEASPAKGARYCWAGEYCSQARHCFVGVRRATLALLSEPLSP